MLVLGIETSCDDTSVSLLEYEERGGKGAPKNIWTLTSNQDDVLNFWGGVVPEISARNHQEKLPTILEKVFSQASKNFEDVDLVGVTHRPGLIGPLMTGVNMAKGYSLLFQKPIYPAHHLMAHLQAIFLTKQDISYPYLGVLVSGGNGFLAWVHGPQDWEIVAQGLDDAPGEAFDKGGRMLQLGYPAGFQIDQLAKKGNPFSIPFPIGMKNTSRCDMSFSGVKTALRYYLEQNPVEKMKEEELWDVCASYQHAIIMGIAQSIKKSEKILQEKYGRNLQTLDIVVGGGVACNSYLREKLQALYPRVYFVDKKYCTDNATMIAHLAYLNSSKALKFPECLSFEVYSSC